MKRDRLKVSPPPAEYSCGGPIWTSRRQFREWADQNSGPAPEFCEGCDAVVRSNTCPYCGTRNKHGLLDRLLKWLGRSQG
jgi:hypothetical protein